MWERYEALKAENAELILENGKKRRSWHWSRKRRLVPRADKAVTNRGPGAPRGNRNAHKHGSYSRERLAFLALVSAFIRDTRDLCEEARQLAQGSRTGRPRSAAAEGL